LHLVGILFPHINEDARSKSHQIYLHQVGTSPYLYITYCLYTWCLNLPVISLCFSLLISFPLCHLCHLFLHLFILGLFYTPLLQLIGLIPGLLFHFAFSFYFFFNSAVSLSLFYVEGCCIDRRSVFDKDFEIMLDTLSSQLHKPTRISRKTLCDPSLLEPFPSLESRFSSQPFSPFLTRAGSSK